MIVVRNVFKLKFGMAREAVDLWKKWIPESKKVSKSNAEIRLLTDLVGDYYTLVVEISAESLTDYDNWSKNTMGSKEFGDWYKKFKPLAEGGYREIMTVEK
ncbi:MAG TPA: hypothetical protein VJ991_05525 [Balneolales bacterium]|nr:hypothetical protein [Balneolales bacterium]